MEKSNLSLKPRRANLIASENNFRSVKYCRICIKNEVLDEDYFKVVLLIQDENIETKSEYCFYKQQSVYKNLNINETIKSVTIFSQIGERDTASELKKGEFQMRSNILNDNVWYEFTETREKPNPSKRGYKRFMLNLIIHEN